MDPPHSQGPNCVPFQALSHFSPCSPKKLTLLHIPVNMWWVGLALQDPLTGTIRWDWHQGDPPHIPQGPNWCPIPAKYFSPCSPKN
jgi:hypothetical protein